MKWPLHVSVLRWILHGIGAFHILYREYACATKQLCFYREDVAAIASSRALKRQKHVWFKCYLQPFYNYGTQQPCRGAAGVKLCSTKALSTTSWLRCVAECVSTPAHVVLGGVIGWK